MYLKKKQKLEGEVLMRTKKAIFSVLTIMLGSLGLMNIVSTDITLPIMFFYGINLFDEYKGVL